MSKHSISRVLREALKQRGEKHLYEIARESGVDYNKLWRFLSHDRPLLLDEADALADYLGCRLVPPKQKAETPARSPDRTATRAAAAPHGQFRELRKG
jgi:hypothetical protein